MTLHLVGKPQAHRRQAPVPSAQGHAQGTAGRARVPQGRPWRVMLPAAEVDRLSV